MANKNRGYIVVNIICNILNSRCFFTKLKTKGLTTNHWLNSYQYIKGKKSNVIRFSSHVSQWRMWTALSHSWGVNKFASNRVCHRYLLLGISTIVTGIQVSLMCHNKSHYMLQYPIACANSLFGPDFSSSDSCFLCCSDTPNYVLRVPIRFRQCGSNDDSKVQVWCALKDWILAVDVSFSLTFNPSCLEILRSSVLSQRRVSKVDRL